MSRSRKPKKPYGLAKAKLEKLIASLTVKDGTDPQAILSQYKGVVSMLGSEGVIDGLVALGHEALLEPLRETLAVSTKPVKPVHDRDTQPVLTKHVRHA